MPKVHNTRRQRAHRLLERLKEGPSFSEPFDETPFNPDEAARQYRIWSTSWILQDLQDLVPEFREKK